MKVLVTGGNGFIGRHVCNALWKSACTMTVFDRVGGKSFRDTNHFHGDIKDPEAVLEAVSQHDGVIHLAGLLGTKETVEYPLPTVQVNILGSLNVFEACKRHSIPCVDITLGNYWMNNPYSISKSAAERFAFCYNKEHGTKIAVVRGMNVYGPGQKLGPVKKLVPTIIWNALKGDDIFVYGEGNQVADMIFVEDIAEILVRALLNEHNVYDREFQAGCGLNTTVNEVVDRIKEITGSSSKVRHMAMRAGEQPNAVVKADRENWQLEKLGWTYEDFTPLCDGLARTVEYYRELLESQEKKGDAA
jgi:UDP-glucose 4-epimerase